MIHYYAGFYRHGCLRIIDWLLVRWSQIILVTILFSWSIGSNYGNRFHWFESCSTVIFQKKQNLKSQDSCLLVFSLGQKPLVIDLGCSLPPFQELKKVKSCIFVKKNYIKKLKIFEKSQKIKWIFFNSQIFDMKWTQKWVCYFFLMFYFQELRIGII